MHTYVHLCRHLLLSTVLVVPEAYVRHVERHAFSSGTMTIPEVSRIVESVNKLQFQCKKKGNNRLSPVNKQVGALHYTTSLIINQIVISR